MTNVDLSSH